MSNYGIKHVSVDLSNSFKGNETEIFSQNPKIENRRKEINYESIETVKNIKTGPIKTHCSKYGVQKVRRSPRVVKDSIGSQCNFHNTDDEFASSKDKIFKFQSPIRHKPESTKIEMLSGDQQKPFL